MSIVYSNVIETSTLTPTPTPTPTVTLHGLPIVSQSSHLIVSRTASVTVNADPPLALDILGNNVYFSCSDGDTFEIIVTDVNVFGVENSSRIFSGVAHEGMVT